MLLGVFSAAFFESPVITMELAVTLGLGILSACIVSSSNYVLNEILDADTDRLHPTKRYRPVPSGLVSVRVAYIEWIGLGLLGLLLALQVSTYFALCICFFWIMGIIYNLPPIRSKDLPYLDVITESINNPIRLFLGWFAVTSVSIPPLSLTLAFWMAGAFFMAVKRYAEYRFIGNKDAAIGYRKSFRHYDEERLVVSILFYVASCALFAGIFMVRYRVELILLVPFVAGLFSYYFRMGQLKDSPTQYPERLLSQHGFVSFLAVTTAVFFLLMSIDLPWLYTLFNIPDGQLWATPPVGDLP